jgi:hypothetical protein
VQVIRYATYIVTEVYFIGIEQTFDVQIASTLDATFQIHHEINLLAIGVEFYRSIGTLTNQYCVVHTI